MKQLLLALTVSLSLIPASFGKTPLPEVLGTWHFEGPQGIELGTPHREMSLHFDERGRSELVSWTRENEGVCRRTAHFWYDEAAQELVERVIGLDPYSPETCQNLSEMRPGTEIRHQVRLAGDQMILTTFTAAGARTESHWSFTFP